MQPGLTQVALATAPIPLARLSSMTPPTVTTDWRRQLPTLRGSVVGLRELRLSDAPALLALISTEEVARFISPPPTTVEGFERFVAWALRQQAAGEYVCFAVALHDAAIGIFQIRRLDPDFGTAEWGFAIGSSFWGTGVFEGAARLILAFAFDVIRVHRLEARSALHNGRGNGALRKIGAVHEGTLRRSLLCRGEYMDQALWSILRDDWRQSKAVWG